MKIQNRANFLGEARTLQSLLIDGLILVSVFTYPQKIKFRINNKLEILPAVSVLLILAMTMCAKVEVKSMSVSRSKKVKKPRS
jgi:hypothetical protein